MKKILNTRPIWPWRDSHKLPRELFTLVDRVLRNFSVKKRNIRINAPEWVQCRHGNKMTSSDNVVHGITTGNSLSELKRLWIPDKNTG